MSKNIIETIMGAVVLIAALGFLFFAYEQGGVKQVDGYVVKAAFTDITGVSTGSDVRLGGMKIGVVGEVDLDPETYQAIAVMEIKDNIKVPKDSSASVASSGLLGDKFIKIQPGGDEAVLKSGDVIRFTQSSVSFEDMIGKFVFSGGGVDQEKSDDGAAADESDSKDDADNPFSLGM